MCNQCIALSGTWNCLEAGHGKGIPDGVGGTVKRMADIQVQRGKDCPNAASFVTDLKSAECKIQLYLVPSKEIDLSIQELSQVALTAIPGTMKIHQLTKVVTTSANGVSCRVLSCLCKRGELCECFSPNHFTFPVDPDLPISAHEESNQVPEIRCG